MIIRTDSKKEVQVMGDKGGPHGPIGTEGPGKPQPSK